MSTISRLFCLISLVAFTACSSNQSTEGEQNSSERSELPAQEKTEIAMHDEIIAVHDEVMPKMDDIMRIKGELLERLDSTRESNPSDADNIAKLESQVSAMEEANEGMMSWMRNWSPPADSVTHEDKMRYYKKQRVAIDKVKEDMLNAIDQGQLLLKSDQ